MNKKLTPKDAFIKLINKELKNRQQELECIDIVTGAIDALEAIKTTKFIVAIPRQTGKSSPLEELLQLQKSIKIIKEKEVNIFTLLHSNDRKTYNYTVVDDQKLTQEEYELLKEVLL